MTSQCAVPDLIADVRAGRIAAYGELYARARKGLRQAYLPQHITAAPRRGHCRFAMGRLGAWVLDALPKRDHDTVDEHLDECLPCGNLAAELAEVADGLVRTA